MSFRDFSPTRISVALVDDSNGGDSDEEDVDDATESSSSAAPIQSKEPTAVNPAVVSVFASLDKHQRGELTRDELTKAIDAAAAKCKIKLHGDVNALTTHWLNGEMTLRATHFLRCLEGRGQYLRPSVAVDAAPSTTTTSFWTRLAAQPPSLIVWWVSYAGLNVGVFFWKFLAYAHKKAAFNLSGYSVCVARGAAQVNLLNGFFLLLPVLTRVQYALAKAAPNIAYAMHMEQRIAFHIAYGTMFYVSGWVHVVGQLVSIFGNIPRASAKTWSQSALSHAIEFQGQPKPRSMAFVATITGWTGVVMLVCSVVAALGKAKYFRTRHLAWNFWAHGFDAILFVLMFAHGCHHWLESAQAGPFLAPPLALYLLVELVPRFFCTKVTAVTKFTKTFDTLVLHLPKTKRFDHCLPGTFLRLNVPSISGSEWHPFSITGADEDHVTVHIQACGDWTSRLHAIVHPNLFVRIDGPIPAPAVDVQQYKVAVLIGAGIGVTPYLAVLQRHVPNQTLYLHWQTNKQELFRSHAKLLEAAIDVHIHTYLTGEFTKNQPVATQLLKLAQKVAHIHQDVDLVSGLRLPIATKLGRPLWQAVLQGVALQHHGELVGVFFCGPLALKEALRRTLRQVEATCREGGNDVRLAFHPEVF
ncbi:Aste57867_15633 [Aphanomyces stellatus]|uniref:Aste57867_15633 protein n=1 Tax=Aphanomyces stellatus TaxID=120398 RepID=A0A485L4H8_9STRA|nr:hypothetical protein As57867_015577 [Aphanomyces stellatus]VFT92430.1 Aste57867_15633 [Aphanomyces stellatus]